MLVIYSYPIERSPIAIMALVRLDTKTKYLLIAAVFGFLSFCDQNLQLGADGLKGAVPDGYLLALKVLQRGKDYNHASLFKIVFDGTVTQLWNYSYDQSHGLFAENLFAIDTKNSLVYLGALDQFLALDMLTGGIKIKIPLKPPNLQYFWNYDYVAEDEAIYGVCYSHESQMWKWCHVKLNGTNNVTLKFLYEFPTVSPIVAPIDNTYYMDKEHQTIWYYPGCYAHGVNYTTGEVIFTSGTAIDLCIAHDHTLNRTFTIINNINAKPRLAELRPEPYPDKVLMELPENLRPNYYGTCTYDHKTHTMIGLMTNVTLSNYTHYYMPTHLLLMDVVGLTNRIVPLPAFQEKWSSDFPVTAVKFVPNNN